jgi:hypothetical protein
MVSTSINRQSDDEVNNRKISNRTDRTEQMEQNMDPPEERDRVGRVEFTQRETEEKARQPEIKQLCLPADMPEA